jgi:hypothetical protein
MVLLRMNFFRQSGGPEELRLFIHTWNYSTAGGTGSKRLKPPAPRPDILLHFINIRLQPGVHAHRMRSRFSGFDVPREAVKTAGLGCWSAGPRLKPGVNENHEEFWLTPHETPSAKSNCHPSWGTTLQICKKPLKVSLVKPTYPV